MMITRTTITKGTSSTLALLLLLALSACRGEGEAVPVAEPRADAGTTHVLGPDPQYGGHVFALGQGEAWVEFIYNEGWGTLTIHLVDENGDGLAFDEPPYLNLVMEDEPRRVDGEEDLDILTGESSWVFEDDGLLGETERARFHLIFGGKPYTPPFAHSHAPAAGGGGHAHSHEAASDPEVRPPPPGVLLELNPIARLVVDHNAHWGLVHLRLIDHLGRPRGFDLPPVIHLRLDEKPMRLEGQFGVDRAWYFQHDALLGEPDRARLQMQVDGVVHIPEFPYRAHEHDHSHELTKEEGIGGPDHMHCDPALCPLAPGADVR